MKIIQKFKAQRRSWFRDQPDYKHVLGLLEQISSPICSNQGPVSISMVRDESDVLDVWLDHLKKTFRTSLIVDHLSVDSISLKLETWCRENNGVYLRLNEPAYIQEAVFVACADYLSRLFVQSVPLVPLDADEFISTRSISVIKKHFEEHTTPLEIRWRNAYPMEFLDYNEALTIKTSLNIFAEKSQVGKTVLASESIFLTRGRWLAGNHMAVDDGGNFVFVEKRTNAEILHLPVRSASQLSDKVAKGNNAYAEMKKFRSRRNMGFHWQKMKEMNVNEFSSKDFIFNYGSKFPKKNQKNLLLNSFQSSLLDYLNNF